MDLGEGVFKISVGFGSSKPKGSFWFVVGFLGFLAFSNGNQAVISSWLERLSTIRRMEMAIALC